MIKSDVSNGTEQTFPALYKYCDSIVLITGVNPDDDNELIGTVVGGSIYPVGQFSRTWNGPLFKRFNGSVTLKNGD